MRTVEIAAPPSDARADTTRRPIVAYVVRSFPRLSQTFVLGEMLALERAGITIRLFAVTDPHEPVVQREVSELRAEVRYLERPSSRRSAIGEHVRAAVAAPRGYLSALVEAIRQRRARDGYRAASIPTCFGQAVRLANELKGSDVDRIHAHFAHDPTLIALLAHHLTGVPFSFTAHARDVYQVPTAPLARRCAAAVAVVTCSGEAARYLRQVAGREHEHRIHMVHHGVDVRAFAPAAAGSVDRTPLIVSVGRLVEKKGSSDLLEALGRVRDGGGEFRCRIYGDGPLRGELMELARDLRLDDRVTFEGPRARWELALELRQADVFALTPHPTVDGDVDGIPNVILEAMASGLPVVATSAGAIGEAVTPDVDGLLVQPRDIDAIARALRALIDDERLRRRLGVRARQTAVERFDASAAVARLVPLLAAHAGERPIAGLLVG
jgi:glycosyltransferase involved in cell wall biosynthesis